MTREMTSAATQEPATREGGGETTKNRPVYRPVTDIYETESGVIVIAEMPGVAPDNVDITLERRVLTIRGQGVGERPMGYRPAYAEYGEGDYERVFTVSEDIDQDQIKATHKDGVLTLQLPKAGPAKAKKIKVNL